MAMNMKLSNKEKKFIIMVLILAVAAAALFLGYVPLKEKVKQKETEVAQKKTELEADLARMVRLHSLNEEIAAYEQGTADSDGRIRALAKSFFAEMRQEDYYMILDRTLKGLGIQYDSVTAGEEALMEIEKAADAGTGSSNKASSNKASSNKASSSNTASKEETASVEEYEGKFVNFDLQFSCTSAQLRTLLRILDLQYNANQLSPGEKPLTSEQLKLRTNKLLIVSAMSSIPQGLTNSGLDGKSWDIVVKCTMTVKFCVLSDQFKEDTENKDLLSFAVKPIPGQAAGTEGGQETQQENQTKK